MCKHAYVHWSFWLNLSIRKRKAPVVPTFRPYTPIFTICELSMHWSHYLLAVRGSSGIIIPTWRPHNYKPLSMTGDLYTFRRRTTTAECHSNTMTGNWVDQRIKWKWVCARACARIRGDQDIVWHSFNVNIVKRRNCSDHRKITFYK